MANYTRGRAGQGTQDDAEEEGDEFGDFGGFEAAEPVADASVSQAQAAASAWLLFNAGNVPGRPDLLCAQNRFPTYLDPSDISSAASEPAGTNQSYPPENRLADAPADLLGAPFSMHEQDRLDQARIAENVLDGTLNAASGSGFLTNHSVSNGRLPDIGLGINEERLFGPSEEIAQALSLPVEDLLPQQPPQEDLAAINWAGVQLQAEVVRPEPNRLEQLVNADNVGVVDNVVQDYLPEGDLAARAAASENTGVPDLALQERLNSLTERRRGLEEELSRVRHDLTTQRLQLQEVQARHAEELDAVRRAGHDAIALVVDQYKEQSRVVVLEQQELAQSHLLDVLTKQNKTFQDLLQLQHEVHERQREEDRQELERRISTAVQEFGLQQQERFSEFLARQQVAQKETLDQAVEAERVASRDQFQQALQDEMHKSEARFKELQVDISQKLEEERRNQEVLLQVARAEEHRLAQEQIHLLVTEERERSREATKSALEASIADMRVYVEEQRQADSRVRRRHLASLDIFLEASRQQLALLLESDKPNPASASPEFSPPSPPSHPQNNGSGDS